MIEVIKNAIDANAFVSTSASAGYVNPVYWDKQLRKYAEQNMVITRFAKVIDTLLGQDGSSINVSLDVAPTMAAALVESTLGSVSAVTMTQVVYTPTEYGKFFQLSDKEARRSFFDAMEDMSMKGGYSLALKRDDFAYDLLVAGAGNAVVANGVDASALASSDSIDYDDIVDAITLIKTDLYKPRALVVSPGGAGQLLKLPQFARADYAGDSDAFRRGLVGKVAGIEVYESTVVAPATNVSTAILIGETQLGEPAFGIARKALPTMRTEYDVLGRFTTIGIVEEWDMKVERANAFATIKYYE